MAINKNNTLMSDTFDLDYVTLKSSSSSVHSNISSVLNYASVLYQEASALEDVTVENFLSILSDAKNISFTGNNKNTAIESFLTTKLSDPDFYIEKRLNIDTQNGDLVLPLKASTKIPVSSIIIETDSNGEIGDRILKDGNDDINVILSESVSSYFKYDKVSSNLDPDPLILSLAFTLSSETVINSIFLKLYAIDDGTYPQIDMVEVSKTGSEWTKIDAQFELNKADYYIRFTPAIIKYARIRFKQNSYNNIKTLFGNKYQYLIGMREISFNQDEYDTTGDYVSIPLSTGKTLSSVKFIADHIFNNDINYKLSANNGGKWIDVKSNDTIQLQDNLTGTLSSTDIMDIRVKISMNKQESVLNVIDSTEYLQYTTSGEYSLKYKPEEYEIFYGKHISFGGTYKYTEALTNEYSTEIILIGVPYDIASLIDIDSTYMLQVKKDGEDIPESDYSILADSDINNSRIAFTTPITTASSITVTFKPFQYSSALENIITLPTRSFYKDTTDFAITKRVEGGAEEQLLSAYYTVTDDSVNNKTLITIKNEYFQSNYIYTIYYIPMFKTDKASTVNINTISIPSLSLANGSGVRVDYKYRDIFDKNLTAFYTPICKGYSVELL